MRWLKYWLVCLLLCGGTSAFAAVSRLPNIILVLADDLGWSELGCYSNHFNLTPNLDQLAAQGMKFTQAYAAAPVCSPSRAALMTGEDPARLHITDYLKSDDQKYLSPDHVTINQQLRRAGYVSGLIGKWHLNGDYGQHRGTPAMFGFDEVICSETEDIRGGSYWHPYKFMKDVPARQPHEYLTDRLNLEAVEFIRRHADQPFFLYLAHYAPHTRLDPRPELLKKYAQRPDAGKNRNNPELAAMLESIDEGVGRIMATLDELNLTRDTVVIFASDNGGERNVTDNHPLRGGKSFLYEGGLRVPCIVRWPGKVKPGSVCDEPVITQDFYPTFMQMARVKPDRKQTVDGLSLVPLLLGGHHLRRSALCWYYPMEKPHFLGGGSAAAIHRGNFKLIEFFDTGTVELYDLKNDLGELHDLAPAMPKRAASLRKQLAEWRTHDGAEPPPQQRGPAAKSK